jgi:outer membrane protein assembly factor BamB
MFYRLFVCALVACLLIGCSSDKKEPLKGERLSVLDMQDALKVEKTDQSVSPILSDPRPNTAWPQMGGNASHKPEHLALSSSTLKRIWRGDIGEGNSKKQKLITAPVVAFGRVFTADSAGLISAFALKDGKKLWQNDLLEDREETATVSGGLSFAIDTLFVTDGIHRVVALDPANGKKRWDKNLNVALRGSPTYHNGRLYLITLNDETLALNPMNGDILWRHRGVSEAAGLLGSPSPAAQESVVITAYNSGDVVALRAENGQEAWSDNLTGVAEFKGRAVTKLSGFRGFPVIDDDFAVVGNAASRTVAIHIPSGERLWQKEFGIIQTPWLTGNSIYALTPQNELVALLKENGSILWKTQLSRFKDPDDKEDITLWGGPILAGQLLWLTNTQEQLVAVNPINGKIIQKIDIGLAVSLPPIIADQTVIVLGDNGTIEAYHP